MQSFTDHSRQLILHMFKVCTVLKFTGIIYSSVRKSLRNVCDVLVEMKDDSTKISGRGSWL